MIKTVKLPSTEAESCRLSMRDTGGTVTGELEDDGPGRAEET